MIHGVTMYGDQRLITKKKEKIARVKREQPGYVDRYDGNLLGGELVA